MAYKEIWACYPCYNNGNSNGSILIYEDHQETSRLRVETIKKHIAEEYCMDLHQLTDLSGRIVENKKIMPIDFSREVRFIQFKYRQPEFKDDGAYGLVCVNAIKEIIQVKNHAIIVLKNDERILSLTGIRKLKEYLNDEEKALKILPHLEGESRETKIIFSFENRKILEKQNK